MPTPPNILVMHMHDAGRYTQPFGHAIATPNIQRAAEQGTLFRHAHCLAPSCSASRSAMLTGMPPHQNGMNGLAHRGFALHDYRKHVVTPLKQAGYTTALSGIQHVARGGEGVAVIGYDHVLTEDASYEPATSAAEQFLKQSHGQPFFLKVGFQAPHRLGESFPMPDGPVDARYVKPPDPLPDNATTRKDMAEYIASVQGTDACMGRIMQALRDGGHADDTLVVITTDHGIAFPDMKCNLTHHGTGVHLSIHGPGVPEGVVCDTLCTHMDLFPTVFDLAGLEPCAWWQGKSLVEAMHGKAEQVHDAVFAEISHHASYEPKRSARTPRFLYVRRYEPRTPVLPNCDNSPSKTLWYDAGWSERPDPEEALFNTVLDPQERWNVADDPRYADALEHLRQTLDDWMQRTDDPLLQGPIPVPEGGVTTAADNYDPAG